MSREVILQVLSEAKAKLLEALIHIRVENQDGKQFDFVSHPRLADTVDSLRKTISDIDDIVYQNN